MLNKLCAHVRNRWALFFFLSITVITFATFSLRTAGWVWDVANAIGYVAFACMLYICFASPGKKSTTKSHQIVSYLALIMVVVHVVFLLVADPVSIEFIKPAAPTYMWMGMIATILLIYLIVSSLSGIKKQLHRDRNGYQKCHRILAWLVIAGSLYHIIVSGFYIAHSWQVALVMVVSLFALWPVTALNNKPLSTLGFWLLSVACIVAFTCVRGWPL